MFGVGARLPGPRPRVFDGAQGRRQLLGQLVSAQGGAGVGEVGDGLLGGTENGAFAGQFGLLVGARVQIVEVGEGLRQLLGARGGVGGGGLEVGDGAATPSSWGCRPP